MGRVRKYKKIKACDPFSQRKKSNVNDVKYDEPPDLYDERVRRDHKKHQRPFDDLEHAEKMLQREALRSLRNAQHDKQTQNTGDQQQLEAKRPEETMKEFKNRVRNATKVTLRDELKKMTKTAQKKKEHMNAKKLKKKLDKQRLNPNATNGGSSRRSAEEEEILNMEFNQRHDGLLRPSDLGAPSFFPKKEVVMFGERVERPPDLKSLGSLLTKRKDRRMEAVAAMVSYGHDDDDEEEEVSDGADEDEDEASASSKRKKRRQNRLDMDALEGDYDALVGGTRRGLDKGIFHSGGGRSAASGSGSSNSNSGSAGQGKQKPGAGTASAAEMEGLRERVQAAYKTLREKRRDAALMQGAAAAGNKANRKKQQQSGEGGQRKGGGGGGFVMMSDLY